MNYQGTQLLDHPMERVWDALLDPTVLRECIAGCESFERTSDTDFAAKVKVSIGPVAARFTSTITMADVTAPQRCTLRFAGQGGVAGFGKGEARVSLTAISPGKTQMDWNADAQVGGKIAQLGSRLIEATVRKMSADFFQQFARQLTSEPRVAEPERVLAAESAQDVVPGSTTRPRWLWGVVLLAGGAAVLAFFLGGTL